MNVPPTVTESPIPGAPDLKKWMCLVCGLVYDEALGWPEDGILPGTRWDELPLGWCCPECGARKEDFEMIEFDEA